MAPQELSAQGSLEVLSDFTSAVSDELRVEVEINGRKRTLPPRPIYSFERDILDSLIDNSVGSDSRGAYLPIKGRWIHGWLTEMDEDYINNIWHGYQYFLRYIEAESSKIDNVATYQRSPGTYDSTYRYILALEDLNLLDRYRREEVPADEYDFNVPDEFRIRTYVRVTSSYTNNKPEWDNPMGSLYDTSEPDVDSDADSDAEEPDSDDKGIDISIDGPTIDSTTILDESEERAIVYLNIIQNVNQTDIADAYNISQSTVSKVVGTYKDLDEDSKNELERIILNTYRGVETQELLENIDAEGGSSQDQSDSVNIGGNQFDVEPVTDNTDSNVNDDESKDGKEEDEQVDQNSEQDNNNSIPEPEYDFSSNEVSISEFDDADLIPKFVDKYFTESVEQSIDEAPVPVENIQTSDFEVGRIATVGPWATGSATPKETQLDIFIGITSSKTSPAFIPPGVSRNLETKLNSNNVFVNAFPEYNINVAYSSAFIQQLKDYVLKRQDEPRYYDYREEKFKEA